MCVFVVVFKRRCGPDVSDLGRCLLLCFTARSCACILGMCIIKYIVKQTFRIIRRDKILDRMN